MYSVNKRARNFLFDKFLTVRNIFTNQGLIDLDFGIDRLNCYIMLEKLYFQAVKRNIENRILTINLLISDDLDFPVFVEAVKWIKA